MEIIDWITELLAVAGLHASGVGITRESWTGLLAVTGSTVLI